MFLQFLQNVFTPNHQFPCQRNNHAETAGLTGSYCSPHRGNRPLRGEGRRSTPGPVTNVYGSPSTGHLVQEFNGPDYNHLDGVCKYRGSSSAGESCEKLMGANTTNSCSGELLFSLEGIGIFKEATIEYTDLSQERSSILWGNFHTGRLPLSATNHENIILRNVRIAPPI